MCDCIEKIEKNIKVAATENRAYKKNIKKVSIKGKVFGIGETVKLITVSEFEVELEGQKKKEIVKVAHSYCPFCGEETEA